MVHWQNYVAPLVHVPQKFIQVGWLELTRSTSDVLLKHFYGLAQFIYENHLYK